MVVVATAGHVDHGKSALVLALTGTDPDRLPEERRRGMTIELGHVHADVGGRTVALVDVPGHERLVGTTLAGLGPAAGVLLVVAADEGWQAQTEEHVAAVRALGLAHVVLVVTKTDRADPAPALADALERLARHGIRPLATATVSARTGEGLGAARAALARLADAAPAGDPGAPVRLWVDRSFTVTGVGTVVTGTLPTGSVRRDDVLAVAGEEVRVRGLEVHGVAVEVATGPTRVAVNLRGVPPTTAPRGSALTTPGAFPPASVLDVALHPISRRLPTHATLHAGTTTTPVRVRPLGRHHARLTLGGALPLVAGDRAVLRDPGAHEVLAGVTVLEADPVAFARRGDAARRAAVLAGGPTASAPSTPVTVAAVPDAVTARPAALAALLAHLDTHPLEPAPADLVAAVQATHLADAERAGRLVRLGGLVLPGDALAVATARLGSLAAGFRAGDAARALGTSRRVAIPVLERLDATAVTVRHPDGTRTLRSVAVRAGQATAGGGPSSMVDPAQRTAHLFDAVAETYDRVGVDFFGPIADGLVAQLDVRPGCRVLDLGCGRGAVLIPLAHAVGPAGLAVGVDVSARMVELCRDEALDEGLEHVQVDVVDVGAVASVHPEWEGVFDAVAASVVLFFLPDPEVALAQWVRLLRPGGLLGVSTFAHQDPRWVAVDGVFHPYLPPEMLDARTSGRTGPFASDAGVEGLLTGAGLTQVRTAHCRVEARFEDPEHWHRFSMSVGQRAMWAAVPEADRPSVRDEAFSLLRAAAAPDGSVTLWQDVRYTLGERP